MGSIMMTRGLLARASFIALFFLPLLNACGSDGDDTRRVPPPPVDTTPPTVTSVSPTDGSTDVETDVVIRAVLSEALAASSVDQASLTLSNGAANVPGTVALSNNTITFTPSAPLEESEDYTATLANTVTDLAGNRLQNQATWSFTTGDFTPPTLTGTSPADGSQDVGVDELVVATLSEALDPASVTPTSLSLTAGGADVLGIAALGVGNTSIEFTPDALLTTFTDYQATLTSTVADPAGNTLPADETWTFRTSLTGTLSAIYTSLEGTDVLRRVDVLDDQVVGRGLLSDDNWTGLEESSISLDPDGTRTAFRVDEDVADLMVGDELFVVAMDGSGLTRVSGTLINGGSVWEYEWSPDGTRLAYIADKDTDGVNELYVVDADGTGETKLTTGINLDESYISWSPTGNFIAVASNTTENPDQALYIAPAGGGALVGISGATTVALDEDVKPRWSPDGTLIAYATANTLFVNDATGTAEAVLSPGTTVDVNQFKWFADSTRLVWRGLDTPGVIPQRLFVATVGVGSGAPLSAEESYEYAIAPNDSLIAFVRAVGPVARALYVVAPDGTGELQVSSAAAQDVRQSTTPVWSPDSSAVLYAERETSMTAYELHLVAPDGTGNATLSDMQATSGELEEFTFAPDGAQVIYGAFSNAAAGGAIYRVATDGSGRTLITDNASGEDAAAFAVRDDSGTVELFKLAFGI
jgi:hypothetical protein